MKIEDVYPLSPLQEGMYYHWLTSPLDYFEQISYTLKGSLAIDAIEKSYQQLVERYAILRTSFTQKLGKDLLQVVRKGVESNFIYQDVSNDKTFSLEVFKKADRDKGFNLEKGSQMRLTVFHLGDNIYEFVWSHHHILMDGWCIGILIREFFQLYQFLKQNETPQLPKVYPYATYIKWLMNVDKEGSLAYWRNYLSNYDTVSTLPIDRSTGKKENKIERKRFSMNAELSKTIRVMCNDLGITENTFFQAAWGILLTKYNNTDDVVFGSVVSGRPAEVEGIEQMIGLFINTIPVRVRVNAGQPLKELLKEVQQGSIEGIPHHYTQLAQIQAETELGRDLFDHILVFENYPVQEMVEQNFSSTNESGELSLLASSDFEQANYDMALVVSPGEQFQFMFKYNGSMFSDEMLHRIQHHFISIASHLAEFPETTIQTIRYLAPEEEEQLLNVFNDTAVSYSAQTLVELFEEQVEKRGAHAAIVFNDTTLSYEQLNEKSNQLGNYLRKKHRVKANDLVGIKLDRSEWMVISILGVLKSGAAYVPIDPEYPQERIDFMKEDSSCKVLIDEDELENFRREQKLYGNVNANPEEKSKPGDLAYVIYTSGSTGLPKGVMIEQKAITNTILAQQKIFDIQEHERGLQFASFSFDASVSELFITLISGATLYIVDETMRKSPLLLEEYIANNKIDFATLPPAYLRLMRPDKLSTMKKLITAGEAAIYEQAVSFSTHGTYYNAYGPTESSICASIFKIEKGGTNIPPVIPVGKPIANTQLYVLDAYERLLPVGIEGEICISGAGLARGYLNREELNKEKFIAHPFKEGERLYKTGDLGKWLPNGSIEFIGRKDEQVKIHGYRVELGEIEHALKEYPQIEAAVVIAKTNQQQQKELLAYVVSKESVNTSELQEHLSRTLPVNMIPGYFIQLDELPLTTNGKIDRKKLPGTDGIQMETGVEYVAPRNELEEKLVNMWEEVIDREKIGVKDNFFKIGGHSLKAALLVSQIRKTFDVDLSLVELFKNPTVEAIAAEIEKTNWVNQEKVEEAEVEKISI